MPRRASRYEQIIEYIFRLHYSEGARDIPFERRDIETAAESLGIRLPKNVGDVIYSFRYRANLPEWIQAKAPTGEGWIIRAAGPSRYRFVASATLSIVPNAMLAETKVPDATPGIITKYALNDEQALLAKVRYNRLIDIFTGTACYALQSHLRTQVPGIGQIETDEVYIGLDRRGAQYVFPVQAKGKTDRLNVVQIEQDSVMCASKFPSLICQPIAAQFMTDDLIALFRFEEGEQGVVLEAERHYRLVSPESVTQADLEAYRVRPQ